MSQTATMPDWNLDVYFPGLDSPELQAAIEAYRNRLKELEDWFDANGIGKREPAVLDDELVALFEETIARFNTLMEEARLLYAYVHGSTDVDSRNERAQARESEVDAESPRMGKLRVRLTAWIGTLPVEELIVASEVAHAHAFPLRRAAKLAAKLMTPPEEALAAELSLTGSTAWGKLHGNMTSQLEVDVELADGVRTLPMSAVRNLAYDPNRDVRRAAYEAEIAAWKRVEVPLAAAMNSIKGEANTLSRKRGWTSCLEEAIFSAHIDADALDAMLEAARDSFPVFRRYLHAKAKALGIGRMAWYDLFAPVGGDREWSYPDAEAFIVENFRTYSEKMAAFAERSFRERWIDAPPKPGKRDGAYCMGTRADESRILMNFKPAFGSVSTLAHELGHAYHNLCLAERTPLQKGTPMTLAETASIFCETIIRKAALKAASAEERIGILEGSLQGACQVVVDITSRFEFESEVFERRAIRELSPRELCEIMTEAQKNTYGDGLEPDVLHPYMWAVKPHYYGRGFYNFPYMFGLLFALGLYAIFESEPDAFRQSYDDLLSSTGLADAATLAAAYGIDIRSKAFWAGSLSVVAEDVAEFERLAG
ncbi:MAG: M3 family oligoendopeptidase [Fimbriimonadaceae bacterium]